jgi:hypothetical protein
LDLYTKPKILKGPESPVACSPSRTTVQLHHVQRRTSKTNLLVVKGSISGKTISILIDGAAESSFINNKSPALLGKTPIATVGIQLANKRVIPGKEYTKLSFTVPGTDTTYSHSRNMIAAPIAYDIILGKDWLDEEDPNISWPNNTVTFNGHHWVCNSPQPKVEHISANVLQRILRKSKNKDIRFGFVFTKPLFNTEISDETLRTTDSKDKADEQALASLPESIRKLIAKFPTVFAPFEGLPPSRPHDHCIQLINPQQKPPSRPLYPMSDSELSALFEELEFLRKNGRIQASTSAYGAPVFYVAQKGKLRLVFDYRALNKNTVKVTSTIPNIQELFDRLSKAKVFSKFDLASGYHQIRVHPNDIPKTAFRIKYGLFEWVVMPFGLSNAPATFQAMVNSIFADHIDNFLLVYLDDLLVFSETEEDHIRHLPMVLQRLQDNQLHCRVAKCEFFKNELEYLGFLIKGNTISVLPSRTSAIQDFEPPTSWTDLRAFCGLANTIHRFVQNHASLVAPLTDKFKGASTRRPNSTPPFSWSTSDQQNFEQVKEKLCEPSVLTLFDPSRPVHLYTDWSERAIGSYVSQPDEDGTEHPVAFASRKCNPAESKYHPYIGEILALVEALRTHRHYIIGRQVKVFTDHRSLEHILDQPKLRPVHHRWLADLLSYDFEIQWMPGSWNTIADALSRRTHTRDAANDPHIPITALNAIFEVHADLFSEIEKMTPDDPEFKEISQHLVDPQDPDTFNDQPPPVPKHLRTRIKRYVLRNKLLYFLDKDNSRLFVPGPLRKRIISLAHDEGPAIHNNWERTAERITRNYHWPSLHRDVINYVNKCDSCQRNKVSRRLPYGLLEPHDAPESRWHTVSIDFVGPIVQTRSGFDTIFCVVDSGSKRVVLIPCKQTDDTKEVARLYELNVWKNHGLPQKIISDRDRRFVSNFWKSLTSSLRIKNNTSTSYHPQTDGQTDQKNGWYITALRHFVHFYQHDWDQHLHVVEYGINDTMNSATGYTPFYLDTGRHPRSLLDLSLNTFDRLSVRDWQACYSVAKDRIRKAQDAYAAQANRHRLPDPFKVDDLVLISMKDFVPPNLRGRPTNKLSNVYSGPYKILAKVGTSYKLDLPSNWSVHPVFHPEKLRPYFWDHAGPHPLSELSIDQRTIERTLAVRTLRVNDIDYHQVLVKWLNHSPVYNSWLPLDDDLKARVRRDLPPSPPPDQAIVHESQA